MIVRGNAALIQFLLVAWVPLTVVLFTMMRPRRAVLTSVLGALLSQRQLTLALRAQQVAVLRAVQLHVLHARAPHDARGGRARRDVVRLVVREVLLGRHGALLE